MVPPTSRSQDTVQKRWPQAAGREAGLMPDVPRVLRELVAWVRRAFGLLNEVQDSVHCPLLIPPADRKNVSMLREIFKGLGEYRGGKTRHSNMSYLYM